MCKVIDMPRTGERLRELCKERGLTAKDIQRLLNLSSTRAVYDWFNGKTLPSIDNLYMLSDILDIPMDEIIVAGDDPGYTTG